MGPLSGEPEAARRGEDVSWFRTDDPTVAGAARRAAVDLAGRLGFTESRAGEVAIAVTEAATNLLKYAREGVLILGLTRAAGQAGIELVALDSGPGIADPAAAAADGWSAGGTLGIGLSAIARLGSGYDMHSVPGRGTVLAVTFWPAAAPAPARLDGLTRAITGEDVCGDAWAVRPAGTASMAMLCDGLGHGPLAARASAAAVRTFLADTADAPADALRRVHAALAGSRGAAVSIVRLDHAAGTVRHAGVGNVASSVIRAGRRSALLSYPGIVGHQARTIRESSHPLGPDDLVVMHSDGLTERWDLTDYPGLAGHRPLVIAATLLRDAGLRRDDAGVLVGRRAVHTTEPR
jgi:anti-sigma regulatory factor (Ser/Thr protein kinase)